MNLYKCVFICALYLLSGAHVGVIAQQASWLPEVKNANKPIRLLECTYNEAELKQSKEVSTDTD